MTGLTHLDDHGQAHMVDVSTKTVTTREAKAITTVTMNNHAYAALRDSTAAKGDVLATARIAGIMAAKKTSELIPLCHPLGLEKVSVEFDTSVPRQVTIIATARITAKTGVEMEAMTAAAVAALTIYDMLKAVDKGIIIDGLKLLEKSGGKSGDWHSNPP